MDDERIESIIKYNGDIIALAKSMGLEVDVLSENYAIMELTPQERQALSLNPQIEYIEVQKLLSFLDNQAITASCITVVQRVNYGLTGQGVLIAFLDSGIDYFHDDFRNPDGTTRIIRIWDQNAEGVPPEGFTIGTEYTQEEINAVLAGTAAENIPTGDLNGHGTAVAGIAAGNGRASAANYFGAAPEASLLIVRLEQSESPYLTKDTNLMRGIKYAIDTATALNMPLVINISYGTNQGSHDGSSLFEQYINDMAGRWKTNIVVANGNEGVSGKHFYGRVETGGRIDVDFTVQSRLDRLSITMLKSFVDDMDIQIVDGSGRVSSIFDLSRDQSVYLGTELINVSIIQPTPYNADQNITLVFSDLSGGTLMATIWTIRIYGMSIINGSINMWLPVTEISGSGTAFLDPEVNTSLTIPATVPKAISVGGYNSLTNTFADFSGRGFTISGVVKPEICAPAVNVRSTTIGGSYGNFTGTSLASPIVAGACALMMQWGILEGNDIYMYGQRLKAFLEYGAVQHAAYLEYPNPNWGYGALCLKNSLDYARTFSYGIGIPAMAALAESTSGILAESVNPAADESYLNYIIRYDDDARDFLSWNPGITVSSILQDLYAVINVPPSQLETVAAGLYTERSVLCGLMANPALDAAGITAVKKQQNLGLTGKGVLVGIVDTGIDYTLDTFRYPDGASKIISIWDQTINSNDSPEGFIYGTEYSNAQINEALADGRPYSFVPSTDQVGHGTFLASLTAGRGTGLNEEGAAPDADLVVVKLKQAKQAVRNYSGITTPGINAYESVDFINGIEYIINVAKNLLRPLVLFIGIGSNDGAHDGYSYFEQYLTYLTTISNVVIVAAVGNEGDKEHHTSGRLSGNEDMAELEFNVSEQTSGFFTSLWSFAPDRLSVSLITPLGGIVERRKFMSNDHISYSFVVEDSQITIDYDYPNYQNGAQSVFIRFLNPQQGLWKLQVYGDLIIDGRFNVWMPVASLWNNSGYFLQPKVDFTAVIPSTAFSVISVGAYNDADGSIYVSGSRGPNIQEKLCPDFVAPGVNVTSVVPGGAAGIMTGTSVSAAVTAGAGALILQWAAVEGNAPAINTMTMKTYLLSGLKQRPEIFYPDNLWGYGELDLIESFQNM